MTVMNQNWNAIADSLRLEIAEYGQLLDLFDEQQRLILRGSPAGVLELANAIQDQVGVVNTRRGEREEAVSEFAAANAQPAASSLRALLPFCEPEARPLLEELMANTNRLLHRVRRGSRQNFRLLSTTVATNQELLRRLRPDDFMKTYAANGRVSVARLR